MYAGLFHQGAWLRSFVRRDIVDDYERKCRKIINSYDGQETTPETIIELFGKLSEELNVMAIKIVDEKQSE